MATDSLSEYLNAIGRYPLLSAEQEIQLSRQIQRCLELKQKDGELTSKERREIKVGERAKEKMIKCNLRLVVNVAKKYIPKLQGNGMDLIDLIQEGNVGLNRAAEKYDGAKGYKFSTYAFWWIRQGITRALATQSRLIKVPQDMLNFVGKAFEVERNYVQEHGKPPSIEYIANTLGVSVDRLRMALERSIPHRSLDQMMLEDGKTLIDLIPDTSTEEEDYTQVEKTERSEQLNLAFFRLEELDRDIVIKHYGINQPRPMTLDEIAKSHKLCRQSVGVRKQKAMNILRLTMAQRLKEPAFH